MHLYGQLVRYQRETSVTLTQAMNTVGGRSNRCEGSEDPTRYLFNKWVAKKVDLKQCN